MTNFPKALIALVAVSISQHVLAHLRNRHNEHGRDDTKKHQTQPRSLLNTHNDKQSPTKFTWESLFELIDNSIERNDRVKYETNDHKIVINGKAYDNFDAWTQSPEFQSSGATCHTRPPTKAEVNESKKVLKQFNETYDCVHNASYNPLCREETDADDRDMEQVPPIHIDTYFHIIHNSKNEGVDGDDVDNSMKTLNDAYAPDFVFVLKQWEITTKDDYYEGSLKSDEKMKKALRKGDCSTLNIYSNDPQNEVLGYATFPNECKWHMALDGVVINDSTVPGGSSSMYNEGDTLVHEVGHWLGLFHTFEGGCYGGDDIGDTPAEKSPAPNCDLKRDTCPGEEGYDPVQNFMDYSPDACMNQFTALQRAEMKAQWEKYRKKASGPSSSSFSDSVYSSSKENIGEIFLNDKHV